MFVCACVMAAVTLAAKGLQVAQLIGLAAFTDCVKVMHDQVLVPVTCVACVAVTLQHDAPDLCPVRSCVDAA